MGKLDEFKAAFMSKERLNGKIDNVVDAVDALLKAASTHATNLPGGSTSAETSAVNQMRGRLNGAKAQGDRSKAWLDLKALEQEVAQLCTELKAKAEAQLAFEAMIPPVLAAIATAEAQARDLPAKQAATELTFLSELRAKVSATRPLGPTGHVVLEHLKQQVETRTAQIQKLGDAARRSPDGKSMAARQKASKVALAAITKRIPAIAKRLQSDSKDAQGRTAKEDIEGRLAAFDQMYADPGTDPDAQRRNAAMRLAAVTAVAATRMAADLNDPYLVPRIGQSIVTEYAPEMSAALPSAAKPADDGTKAKPNKAAALPPELQLAQALVMDDPLTKLLTGKIDPADAVQRIRDMATVGNEKPSVMLTLLRQQFEMKMASLTKAQVTAGIKGKDKGAKGNFELSDITGELSGGQYHTMLERPGEAAEDRAKRKGDGTGLEFKSAVSQMHRVVAGDTFASLAQTYLGDPTKWETIRALNKVVVERKAVKGKPDAEVRHALEGQKAGDALPVGLSLQVPGKLSLLDQLAPYLAAWDDEDTGKDTDKYKGKQKDKATEVDHALATPPQAVGTLPDEPDAATQKKRVRIDQAMLAKGAAALKSPREDPAYLQVPGLGQEHQVRAPLGAEADLSPAQRAQAEAEKLHGQINQRQYAHMRMLERADKDERDAILARTGKTVDAIVLERIKARYDKMDDAKAQRIADAVAGWIAKVPLTITFTGDRLFSDHGQDAPTHGTQYKSEVELSRGTADKKAVVGRDSAGPGTMGTQGGSKTVTGWKERGENYMRWRRDKDAREGRNDELAYEDQQIYGAANPTFEVTKGSTPSEDGKDLGFGANYYGDAHFLLRDSVRSRCAFIVRTSSDNSNVQRRDVKMLVYDMLTKLQDTKFLDAMLQMASGATNVRPPGLTWEVHLYGGFDTSKDAKAIYLSNGVSPEAAGRIKRFAKANGIECKSIGDKPDGLDIVTAVDPKKIDLSKFSSSVQSR